MDPALLRSPNCASFIPQGCVPQSAGGAIICSLLPPLPCLNRKGHGSQTFVYTKAEQHSNSDLAWGHSESRGGAPASRAHSLPLP